MNKLEKANTERLFWRALAICIILVYLSAVLVNSIQLDKKEKEIERLNYQLDFYDKWLKDCFEKRSEYYNLYINIDDINKTNPKIYLEGEWE